MRNYLHICLILISTQCWCQNLVPNGDFENHNNCDENFVSSSIENCNAWFNAVEPLSTVDWYSDCFCLIPSIYFCPPNLVWGNSYPKSNTAMIGFGPYSEITNLGESVGVRLNEPLKKDSAYCFGFWVKNSRHNDLEYLLKEFNVAFINDTSGVNSRYDILNYVDLPNYSDQEGWHYLSNYYIAEGGEEFMLIGALKASPDCYFHENTPNSKKYVYYFFDDFSVTPCNKDSLLAVICEFPNVFSPDGSSVNDLYVLQLRNIKKLDIQIFNRWGNVVKAYDGVTDIWDGTDQQGEPLSEGVYFIKALAETNFGELISKYQYVHLVR
jgi:gliding motility-associated-like protein